ncbi:hypothetical protein SEA_MARSHAWN_5 [Mycobacterium phage Marshawn]|uniref:Acb2/Tad1 hairpin domain-containing protein n=1 Tax=Mycobacterium phage Marshawn TaxID=2652423 RepID=A0A5P8D7Z2_9CAUD|nr:hypothetical protein I5H02_gp94 [Mycobacterium phage Marshawn]QFP94791.1 hypothetical protein SEA_MARSHAWN_5 [Mycobacterium phage Marshawn]
MSYSNDASSAEIENRFSYHPAADADRRMDHEHIRGACRALAHGFDSELPPGRQKALALTALEEAMHWANASIACQNDCTP